MKKFFENRKKATMVIVGTVLLIAVIAIIAIFATTAFAESGSIGKQNAQNFAFVDAKVTPEEVENLKTEFEFKNGQFIYEVEFDANGTEYDYWVKSSDGSIVKKEVDATDDITNQQQEGRNTQTNEQQGNNPQVSETNAESNNNAKNNQAAQTNDTNSKDVISLETAKSKALSNAGVSASKATFTKTELDYDDGVQVYDIEFRTSDNKYEYEINAKTGAIYKKEIETIKNKTTGNKTTNSNSSSNSKDIGVDKAKSIALKHAGVSSVEYFEKAKLDYDDGKPVYEIEFHKNGKEYNYEIDAKTGKILEYDIDNDND